jgi:uncharacterized protein YbaP (TraB family)
MKVLFLLVGFLIALPLDSRATSLCALDSRVGESGKGMLFQVKKDNELLAYIFGTLHVGYDRITALPDSVEVALSKSKKFYLEWDNRDASRQTNELIRLFPASTPRNLRSVLDVDAYAKLTAHLDLLKLPNEARVAVESWHPGQILSALIEGFPLEMNQNKSLDELLFEVVSKKGIEIDEIESTRAHFEPIASISNQDWSALTSEMMNDALCHSCIEKRKENLLCAAELTRVGDADGLFTLYDTFYQTHPAERVRMDKLAFSRNRGMAEKIASLLGNESLFFVSIGSLHLGGKIGVIQRLRDMGYTVERVLQ